MEHKTWHWKKNPSERSILVRVKSDLLVEKEKALILERSLQDLNEQISFARAESDLKDDLLTKQAKATEEAIAGWEKAEAESILFKQQLDDALQQKAVAEDQLANTVKTLEDCMQQLHALEKEQENIILDAAKNISRVQEDVQALESKLAETTRSIGELNTENTNLCRILEIKEKAIKELTKSLAKTESRLDSAAKQDASLKYEICMLQKELEIRNKEREYNLKSADAAYKQQLESAKKITKLETECQKLRLMVRKRLPGPAALANMKSEVELLNSTGTRKKRLSSPTTFTSHDYASRKHNLIPEKVRELEDENNILKVSLTRKNTKLQSMQLMLSQCERRLGELSERQACFDPEKSSRAIYHKHTPISEEFGNDDNVNCAESWASALISELEHFKSRKPTTPSISNLSFMDDYLKMEKLAGCKELILIDGKYGATTTKESDFGTDLSETTGKELILVGNISDNHQTNHEITSKPQDTLDSFEKALPRSACNIDQESPVAKLIQEFEGMMKRCMKNHDGQLAFSWETAEISAVLQRFVLACKGTLHGKADLESFVYEVSLALEWIIYHSFSLQASDIWEHIENVGHDVSQLNDKFKFLTNSPISETNKMNEHNDIEMETSNGHKVFQKKLEKLSMQNETPITPCLIARDNASYCLEEEHVVKECKGFMEYQNQDLGTELTTSVVEIAWACQKLSPSVVDPGKENDCCEPICPQSQLQLESAITTESQKHTAQEEKKLRTDSEIAAAAEKLAECQEAIMNLGKQLKVLAAPKDAPLLDKTTTTPETTASSCHHSRLLYQVLAAEDGAESKEITCAEPQDGMAFWQNVCTGDDDDGDSDSVKAIIHPTPPKPTGGKINRMVAEADMMVLALNPKRRRVGVSLLKRWFFRRKTESSKKLA